MEDSETFIDLCLGEWIRVGDVALVVLDARRSQVQFAIEGLDEPATTTLTPETDLEYQDRDAPCGQTSL